MNLTIFIMANDSETEYVSFNTRKKEVKIRTKNFIEWYPFNEVLVELDDEEISLEELLKEIKDEFKSWK